MIEKCSNCGWIINSLIPHPPGICVPCYRRGFLEAPATKKSVFSDLIKDTDKGVEAEQICIKKDRKEK